MLSVNDVSLGVFMIIISLAFFYLYKIMKAYLIEYKLERRKEITELETYIRDSVIRLGKLENEIVGLKDILTNMTFRKERIEIIPKKTFTRSLETKEMKKKKRSEEIHLNKTEIEILRLLIKEGGLTSSQVREKLGLSREHIARTLKRLFENKLVERNENEKPFKYIISENKIEELRKIIF